MIFQHLYVYNMCLIEQVKNVSITIVTYVEYEHEMYSMTQFYHSLCYDLLFCAEMTYLFLWARLIWFYIALRVHFMFGTRKAHVLIGWFGF